MKRGFRLLICGILLLSMLSPLLALTPAERVKRALERVRVKDYSTAISEFEQILTEGPQDLETRYLLAATLYANKEYNKARAALQKLLILDPSHPRARTLLPAVEAVMKPEDDKKGVSPQAASPELKIAALMDKAASLSQGTTRKEAMDVYREVLRIDPNHFNALTSLAELEEKFGNPETALQCWDRLVKHHGKNKTIYARLEGFLVRNLRTERALRTVKQYLNSGGDRAECERLMVALYLQTQAFGSAAEILKKQLAANPEDAETWERMVRLHRAARDTRGLIEALKKMVELQRDTPVWRIELSEVFEENGVHDLAFQTMMEIPASQRDGRYFRRLIDLGRQAGEPALVDGAYEQLIDEEPGTALKVEYLDRLISRDERGKALKLLQKWLETTPTDPALITRLRDLSLQGTDKETAFTALSRYVEQTPRAVAARRRLEALAVELGRKLNLPPVPEDGDPPIPDPALFEASLRQTRESGQGALKAFVARIRHEALVKMERDGQEYQLANVRALERLINELYMLPDEAERLAGYQALMNLLRREPVAGCVLFIQYLPAENGNGFTHRVIVVTGAPGEAPKIRQEAWTSPSAPGWFSLPGKMIFDNELPVPAGEGDYDEEEILARYDALLILFQRIEGERQALRTEIIRRVESRTPADLSVTVRILPWLLAVEGIRPAELAGVTQSLRQALRTDLPLDLLETVEKTWGYFARIRLWLDEVSPGLLTELNRTQDLEERRMIFKKHVKKDHPVRVWINLED